MVYFLLYLRTNSHSGKSARNPYNLRSQSHIKRICGTSMRNSAPKLWNILSAVIKSANSVYILKRRIRKYFTTFSQMPSTLS